MREVRSVLERLNALLTPDGDCLVWTGTRDKNGYGHIRVGSRTDRSRRVVRTNRLALELHLGRNLLPGMHALHHCDNPPCCKAEHLYEGTALQNSTDIIKRGRHPRAQQTSCKRGHPLLGGNLITNKRGHRRCREARI